MDKQSFNIYSLSKIITKSDFKNIKKNEQVSFCQKLIADAIYSANNYFSDTHNLLSSFNLRGNTVFKINEHHHRIIERQIYKSLKLSFGRECTNRETIINNLKLLLKENVEYKIYRLDIQKFFESFDSQEVLNYINTAEYLSPKNKRLIVKILNEHHKLGGTGCPRGLSISSVLSDAMMASFDKKIKSHHEVFYYARYVDDIIVLTSARENKEEFIEEVKYNLPKGLLLNESKTQESPVISYKGHSKKNIYSFEYLGYEIRISNGIDKNSRCIEFDIANKKVVKYQRKICQAFYDFCKNKDENLLLDRINFLTKNFKVFNPHLSRIKLTGIYYNYPAIEGNMKNLYKLDGYLKVLVLSKKHRLRKLLDKNLSSSLKRKILSNSFIKGHRERIFIYFHPNRIKRIKKCW